MAEKKFDYVAVGAEYKNFKNIVGDASDASSIAGILDTANKEIEGMCNVEDEAIFGNLGAQLKLDWDNFSSDFPNFIAVFNNWAANVAATGSDYSQVEAEIAAMKAESQAHGFAGRGLDSDYISGSTYQQYLNNNYEQFNNDLANLGGLYELTGAEYVDTGTVAQYEGHVGRVKAAEGFAAAAVVVAAAATVAHFVLPAGGSTALVPVEGGVTAGGAGAAPMTPLLGEGSAVSITEFGQFVAANGTAEQVAAVAAMQEAGVTTIVTNGSGVVQFLNASGQVVGATTYGTAATTAASTAAAGATFTDVAATGSTVAGAGSWFSGAAAGGRAAWAAVKGAAAKGAAFVSTPVGRRVARAAAGAGAGIALYSFLRNKK